jgi:hypothetical protein
MSEKMKYPFEAELSEIQEKPETFISVVFSSLASEFLILPKGDGFVEYAVFETGYEALKKVTNGFTSLSCSDILKTVVDVPISAVVLRAMLGFTPSEWAYVASQQTGLELGQGFARTLDRKIRLAPMTPLRTSSGMLNRVEAMTR